MHLLSQEEDGEWYIQVATAERVIGPGHVQHRVSAQTIFPPKVWQVIESATTFRKAEDMLPAIVFEVQTSNMPQA